VEQKRVDYILEVIRNQGRVQDLGSGGQKSPVVSSGKASIRGSSPGDLL